MVRYARTFVTFALFAPALFGFRPDGDVHPVITTGPASMIDGMNGTVTVTVDQAGSTDTTLYISTSNPSALSVPSSVDLPAGQTQVQFRVTASVSASGSPTVTATANGYYATSGAIALTHS